ncbi:MAG: TonB-dependent receptor [Pseudomonadales bacterium]
MKLKPVNKALLYTFLAIPAAASAAQNQQPMEEVVVTGSLIKGTPLDTALPVEVYSSAELDELGGPTALEFVKSLTVSGATTGENYYFSGASLGGDVGVNLRGLGADKTLTLLNGRRLIGNTTSTVAGGGVNTAMLPSMAFARVEILKDGAAVTYGADATGGVVNFITYENFTGLKLQSSYKNYGNDGDWNVGGLWGFGEGATNVIVSAEWEHRSELDSTERDFASLPYSVNPAPWSTLTNLAGWVPQTAGGTPLGLASDFTPASCEAVGGVYSNGYTCRYDYVPYYNLVEDSDTYRLFLQVNSDITDTDKFHMELNFARLHVPHALGSPAQPVIRGPAVAQGATYQFSVPVTNPYYAEFASRSGWAANPLAGLTSVVKPITYRAFAHGGNPYYAEGGNFGVPTEVDKRYIHFVAGFDGTTLFNQPVGYDVALTVNHSTEYVDAPDVIGYRLQEALNGFGGPDCNATDMDTTQFGTQNPGAAGTGNCMWWNPFASAWAGQPVLGLSNPSYVPGSEIPNELIAWVFDKRGSETIAWNATIDAVLSGNLGVSLPGGDIAWAAGTQWRTTKLRDNVPDPLYNGSQPCAWPGQDPADPTDPTFTGCTPDRPGPFVFFDTNPPTAEKQNQQSYFAQVDLPVLDSLYVILAGRYEKFSPGDLDATVYKASFKWAPTDSLTFRGSYGTNYQAPGLGITPGEITNGVNSYTVAAGNWRGAQTITENSIKPETAKVYNLGAVFQSELGDGDVLASVDYWSVKTQDELGLLASANDIANAVFSINNPASGGFKFADCSSPFISRVTFNGGACVQGTTTADDFSNITTAYGNGPGQTTNGLDIRLEYGMAAFEGEMRFTLQATNILKYETTPTILDGVTLIPTDDKLGYLGFATIAQAHPEWRSNFDINYSRDVHNVRFRVNFVSGVDDDRYVDKATGQLKSESALIPPTGYVAGTNGTTLISTPSYYGVFGKNWLSFDVHYIGAFEFATITASIVNITDKDPPASRQELGYDPRIGNPYGRTFEIGISKEF